MARPLRIEFAGVLYHVTSRGDGREAIYVGEKDQLVWLDVVGQVRERFNWVIHGYKRVRGNKRVRGQEGTGAGFVSCMDAESEDA